MMKKSFNWFALVAIVALIVAVVAVVLVFRGGVVQMGPFNRQIDLTDCRRVYALPGTSDIHAALQCKTNEVLVDSFINCPWQGRQKIVIQAGLALWNTNFAYPSVKYFTCLDIEDSNEGVDTFVAPDILHSYGSCCKVK